MLDVIAASRQLRCKANDFYIIAKTGLREKRGRGLLNFTPLSSMVINNHIIISCFGQNSVKTFRE
jgi:hypothetical protein